MQTKIHELKTFNWRLWIALCAMALIPAIYQTIRTFLISSVGQANAFDIIGQMEWFDLINETLHAFLIIPLYSVLNRIFKNYENKFSDAVFKTGFITLILYTLFSVGVLVYGETLINAMNSTEIDLSATSTYLRLETIAFMTGIIISFANVVFVVIGNHINVYFFLIVRTVLLLTADILLVPIWGIYGIATSNIIVNTLLSLTCILLLFRQKYIRFCTFNKKDLIILHRWIKTGIFSGLQQFIDNFIYTIMVCKMVNMVAEQGNYWIANNFIWSWLLIPISALSEVIRSDCKKGYTKLHQFNYYFISASCVLLWIITIPTWIPFFHYVQGLGNADEIFAIVIRLIPFYVAYAGCSIIDNIFIGLGRTNYTFINSLIINFVYYGFFYLMYQINAIKFDMNTIILMFGFGMIIHFIISVTEEKIFFKNSLIATNDQVK